ncbi:MAG: response regulator transcription factor [candidate division Zixibacteria bacterium]|nr:response regulator transcription factor [candidate division Zixibacteria bacterium]
MENILIIEDELDIVELVRFNFTKEGYTVNSAQTGEEGIRIARSTLPHLILLDLMLPGIDGFEVCRSLKFDEKTRHIPIIMLTAKDDDTDVVSGLEIGANDYLTKPFSPKVLIARVRAMLRRRISESADEKPPLRFENLVIDPGRYKVSVDDSTVNLTTTEFLLLYTIAKRPGWVFNRSMLIDEIRGPDVITTDRAIDVQIAALRKKLGHYGEYIETVRGIGYRFRES